MELIATIFGAGMLRDVRLAGSGELGRAGSIRQHRLSGSIREARMRLGDLSATGEQINFDGRVRPQFHDSRRQPWSSRWRWSGIQVRSHDLNLESGRFRGRIAGELRGDDLLPRTWLVDGAFPSGSFTGRNLAGTFDGGSGRLRFASGRLDALEMLFSAVCCGAPADGAEDSPLEVHLACVVGCIRLRRPNRLEGRRPGGTRHVPRFSRRGRSAWPPRS